MISNLKPRLIKAAVIAGVDKFVYSQGVEPKQVGLDVVNISIADMYTVDAVSGLAGGALSSMDAGQRRMLLDIVVLVAQDMAMQRLIGSRKRSLVESVVSFGAADISEPMISRSLGL